MYRAFVMKESPVTTEEILAVYESMEKQVKPRVQGKLSVQFRSSALSSNKADQYSYPEPPYMDYDRIEELRSAKIFLMNISMWSKNSYTQIHMRGLDNIGRNIILIACYDEEVYILIKDALEHIFPGLYIDDKGDAVNASEKLDAETWDPDMEEDGEDLALEALRAMG